MTKCKELFICSNLFSSQLNTYQPSVMLYSLQVQYAFVCLWVTPKGTPWVFGWEGGSPWQNVDTWRAGNDNSLSVCDTLIHSPVKMLFLCLSSSDLNGIWPLWWQGTSSECLLWLQWMRPWSPLGFWHFSGIHLWWGRWWKRPGTGRKVGPSEVGLFSTLFLLNQEG